MMRVVWRNYLERAYVLGKDTLPPEFSKTGSEKFPVLEWHGLSGCEDGEACWRDGMILIVPPTFLGEVDTEPFLVDPDKFTDYVTVVPVDGLENPEAKAFHAGYEQGFIDAQTDGVVAITKAPGIGVNAHAHAKHAAETLGKLKVRDLSQRRGGE